MVKHNVSFNLTFRQKAFLEYMNEEKGFNRSTWLENELDEKIEEEGWTYSWKISTDRNEFSRITIGVLLES